MAAIHHRGIAASPAAVREALTTIEGLASWWTRDAVGDPTKGGRLSFFFGQPKPSAVMEVIDVTIDHVGWRCVEGSEEWVGTELNFDLSSTAEEAVILFSHDGWREVSEFMSHCSTKSGYFLLGLKAGLEGRESTPFPTDMHISNWG